MEGLRVKKQSIVIPGDSLYLFNLTSPSADNHEDQEPLVPDVWVGFVLFFMMLSCLGCSCSCLLYYKFQKWKASGGGQEVLSNHGDLERRPSKEGPPSYTLVTGLPTYDQAVELARQSPGFGIVSTSANVPYRNEATQAFSNVSTQEDNSQYVKGVYPNPPLTPPSPQRVASSSHRVTIESQSLPNIHRPFKL